MTYADDTCLSFSDNSWENVYLKATNGLNLTYECLNKLCQTTNYDKTMYMKFSLNKCNNYVSPLLIQLL